MRNLNELDLILGEALEMTNDAACLIRASEELETRVNLMDIGHAINRMWDIRDRIYELDPKLKPDFVAENRADKVRFNELQEVYVKATKSEHNGSYTEARSCYEELLDKSKYGHYTRLAEAGLYRVSTKS